MIENDMFEERIEEIVEGLNGMHDRNTEGKEYRSGQKSGFLYALKIYREYKEYGGLR